MDLHKQVLFFGTIATFYSASADAKYSPSSGSSSDHYLQPKQKQPVILMHKQALSEDGAFNFAFAGDNGIKQGETISPDGTRTGAYSYVDPNGETISVKYTAGKDGFKILQGDHIPRASVAIPAVHNQAGPSPHFRYHNLPSASAASSDETDDVGFGPTGSYSQHRAKINPAFKSLYRVHEDASSAEVYPQSVPAYPRHHNHHRQELEQDEHKGPHSFGSGYSFEFGHSS